MTEQADLKARVEELRRVAEAATPGPWTLDEEDRTAWFGEVPVVDCHQKYADTAWESPAAALNNARYVATFDPPTVLALLSSITDLEAERDEARNELAAHDRAMANARRRWREHPMMQRLDAVRQSIAGLRPGDAEWLATAQSEFLNVEARAQAAESRLALAEAALADLEKPGAR